MQLLTLEIHKLVNNIFTVLKAKYVYCGAADPNGLAGQDEGSWPLGRWDCGFESRRGDACLSVVNVVCCQVEVSASG